uniref:Uncharacterized protein n=1 Tax=Anguilla anguilla TaxID=7936 RepID=A0A0E9P5R7_ANGAN
MELHNAVRIYLMWLKQVEKRKRYENHTNEAATITKCPPLALHSHGDAGHRWCVPHHHAFACYASLTQQKTPTAFISVASMILCRTFQTVF